MNFQNLNFDYVEQHRRDPQHPTTGPISPSIYSEATLPDLDLDYASSRPASPTITAPYIATPPSPSDSTPEFYGPDRFFPPSIIQQGLPPAGHDQRSGAHNIQYGAMESRQDTAMLTGFRDDLARQAGTVTPGVDDTPYIQYAIEALSHDRDTGYSGNDTLSSNVAASVPQIVPSRSRGYYQAYMPPSSRQGPTQPAPVHHNLDDRADEQPRGLGQLAALGMETHGFDDSASNPWIPRIKPKMIQPHEWRPMDRDAMTDQISEEKAGGFPPIHFLPVLLRPLSFAVLMILCLLMMAALIFCAVYSQTNRGLVQYSGSINGGQYFIFRMLPQLLAAFILIYAQCIVATMFRIIPFVRLASSRFQDRDGAIFQDLYPNSFLWPRLIGSWETWVPILVTWLLSITLPLQSSLFTVVRVDGVWTWATVQGVVWTLVALYVALFVATVIGISFWIRIKKTGLLWDPRSIADIIAMFSETNTAADYQGTQLARTRDRLRFALRRRRGDRLGYWTWKDGRPGFWYTFGNALDDENTLPFPDIHDKHEKGGALLFGDHDVEAATSYRGYLPRWLRTGPLLCLVLVAFALLLALFLVSFLPSTQITAGFRPWLAAKPEEGAFSAADFLYSFLPSLVGLLLWLLFQSLDVAFRVLQPWAALAGDQGARAEQSLLADYASCVPVQSSIKAARNGHWRVAAISLLSPLFLLLPILGGGMFMALTRPDGQVRMYPNIPAFAVALALLALYFLALASMVPGRGRFRLPHDVSCLAEVASFLANEDLLADPAFKQCRSRREMLGKLGLGRGTRETQPRWTFASAAGSPGGVPGVRRLRRFTEKRAVRKSQIRRSDPDNVAW